MRNQILGFTAAIALGGLMSFGARAQTSGYFTIDQATAGAQIYQAKCASCHGGEMEGYIGPALRGHAFQVITTRESSADRMLLIISRNEPQDNPGGLSDEQDADVLAYILQVNGFPAGKEKLSAFTARQLNLAR